MAAEEDIVNTDGGFLDFMFDMEKRALEDIGDEEALKIVEAERKAAMDEYVKELDAEGLTPEDVA
ncbi:MAG: hypothetical protein PUJ78_03305 [Coriobacteriaceae bacterium]|nr:hypothetical protein [Coriobacteriaceae bacterium]